MSITRIIETKRMTCNKKNDDWKTMVNLERYHVMSEKEILEKLNSENPSRNSSTSDHAMKAWEN